MKPRSVFLLLMSLLVTSACSNKNNNPDASGTFESTEIIVSSEASGKIIQLDIIEGQSVEKGQVVGLVDSVQLYLKKRQLQASLKAIQGRRPETGKQIAALQDQITTAIKEKKRIENLLAANAANQKQMDDISAQISVLEKQLEALKSTLKITDNGITDESSVMDIQISQLEDQLQKCKVTSPIKGTILVKYAEAGEVTVPGKAIFKVADMEQMILRAYVTANQLTRLKTGQKVKVSADFGEDGSREYPGVLSWISDKAEFTPKTIQTRDERANLVYAIKVTVRNDGYLKIGMYGQIQLTMDS